LNPLGFHSENRYREETPLGSNFMSNEVKYEAETRVFGVSPANLADDLVINGIMKNLDEGLIPVLKAGIKGGVNTAGEASEVAIRQEAADAIADGMQAQIKLILKNAGKAGDDLGKAGAKIVDDVTGSITKMIDDGVMNPKAGDDLIKAFTKQVDDAGGAAKFLDEGLTPAVTNVDEAVANADNLLKNSKGLPKWATQGAMVGTAVGATVWLVYKIGDNMGAVGKEWVDDFTGANCGKKVADRGLEGGTEEFNLEVEECQEAAAKRMLIATGGGLLVVCGLIYVIVKK